MKKLFRKTSLFILFLITGITAFSGFFLKVDSVSAEIGNKEFVNLVLTGGQDYHPYHYFDNLERATHTDSNISYYNKLGEVTNKYRAIQADMGVNFSRENSTGYSSVSLLGAMKTLTGTGKYFAYASAGLVALNADENSKIVISLSANEQTVSATSNKVHKKASVYNPDWVQTDKIYITNPDEILKFSFTNKEGGSIWNPADFLIFEPTITFGLEVNEIITNMKDKTVAQGELTELKAETFLTGLEGEGDLLAYYKNYHKIEWEITKGSELGYVSGSYLNVTGDSGTIKVRARCRASTENEDYIYSKEITYTIDGSIKVLTLETNFPDGATLLGGGVYYSNESDAVIFTQIKDGYTFLKYIDDKGNSIDYEVTKTGNYRAVVSLEKSKTITALLVKDIKINEIFVENKYYDKNNTATINSVVINGILPDHDITIHSNLEAKFSSVLPNENIYIILANGVTLSGSDLYMYNFNPSLPDTHADILKRDILVEAHSAEKEYGQDDPTLTYSFSGDILTGDNLIGALSRKEGENIGEYEITLGTLNNPNYNIIFTSNTLKITKRKIEITNVNVANKIYDQTALIEAGNISITKTGAISNGNAVLKYEAFYEDSSAGVNLLISFNAWIEGDEKDFYELTVSVSEIRGDILPRPILISADEKIKTYGDVDPLLTYTLKQGDLLDGDIIKGDISRSEGENTGEYRINIGTLSIENYEIEFISANLKINKKEISVKANESGKIYGNADPNLTFEILSENINKENLGLTLARSMGESVGNYEILIENQLNLNYDITFISADFTIIKRNLTIDISTKEKYYDGKLSGEILVDFINLIATDFLTLAAESQFDFANVGDRTVSYYINNKLIEDFDETIIVGESASNYNIDFNISYQSKINKKEVILKLSDNAVISKKYGDADQEILYKVEGIAEGEKLFGNLTRTTGENAGSYSINQGTITNENNPNYTIIFDCNEVYSILKRDIKIVVDNETIMYGELDNEIEYYLSPTTPLQDGVNLNDLISGVPSRESGVTFGQYKYISGSLILNQSIRMNYNLIFEGGALTINKRPIEIKVSDLTKTYGESDPKISYEVTSGELVNLKDLTFEREIGENTGSYEIKAVLIDSYEVILQSGNLTVLPAQLEIKANTLLKTYGNNDPELTYIITKGILMFNDTLATVFEGTLERDAGENAGTYTINQGSLKSNSNYLITFESGKLIIQKKSIIVTADKASKFLDEEERPAFTYKTTGLVENDTLSGHLTVGETNGLGEYDILIGTLASDNYNITFVGAKYSILKRSLVITIEYSSKEYDGTDFADLTYSFSGDIAEGDESNLGIVLSKESGKDVGKYLITATASNEKYEVFVNTNYFEIVPREITIKARNEVITYGEAVPDFTYTVDGQIINNELNVSLYRTQNYCAGEFEILGTITNTRNYEVTFIPGTLTIKKKIINITVSDYQKVYSQSDPIFDYNIEEDDLYNGDILQGVISREEGKNVGEYKLICSLVNDNYTIVMNEAKLTILPKELVIVTAALDKIFDGTDVAYLRSPVLSGVVDGDDIIFDYNISMLARFENSEVGDNKKVVVYGGELVGEDAGNYYLTRPTNLTANIANAKIEDDSGEVLVIAPKTNTRLKKGTTLHSKEAIAEKENFSRTKNVISTYNVSLLYNNETMESYGTLTVAFDLGEREYFNVQLYRLKSDGAMELIKSKYEDGKIVFDTDTLGTYVVVADNDNWIDLTLIVIATCFLLITAGMLFKKKRKIRNKKQ